MIDGLISNDWVAVGLVARWTALLTLAWLGHRAVAGRNPRWRVALWRSAVVGILGVGLLTMTPPVLRLPVVPASKPVVVVRSEVSTPPIQVIKTAREPDPVVPQNRDALAPVSEVPGSSLRKAGSILPTLVGLWVVGILVLTARIARAGLSLSRIIGRSAPAPEPVVARCREVAQAIGAPVVRVVCSTEVASPCLAGLWRPVLLLPGVAEDDLRGVLAHELAHARGHDLVWNLAAEGSTILLWFHPMAWRLRAVHGSACDAVSDAVAADFLGDVPTYTRTLARIAIAALAPPPSTGLAMARSSDVRRRVDALDRQVFRSPLPRRIALPATLAGGLLLILIGGLAITDASPRSPDQAVGPVVSSPDGRLEIQAVDAATGKPLQAASVVWELRVNQGRYARTTSSTDPEGRAVLEWPQGSTVNGLTVTARKPGFVPYTIRLDGRTRPIQLPVLKVFRLVTGVTIGGMVQNEAGKPVAGARITLNGPSTEAEESHYFSEVGTATTNDQGRWKADDVPADLDRVQLAVQAQGFVPMGGPASRGLEALTVLKRGFTVKGRVLDRQGQPVVGARARAGDNWSQEPKPSTTDAQGNFVIENCAPGASMITVQAEGLAPGLQEIHPEDQPTLEFRLEPGHLLRGKVVDRQGQPVANAIVAVNKWREHQSLSFRVNTDKDGRFEWRGAPDDPVFFGLAKEGFMDRRDLALTHSDVEQVVTLDPELILSGRVIDAETGRPVPTFRVVRGLVFSNFPTVHWMVQEGSEYHDGKYLFKQSEPMAGYAVRVEAAGYKPADSTVFKPGEASATFDFSLARAAAADLLTGVVLSTEGRPVAGAEVALATSEHPLLFETESFRFGRSNGMSFTKTGPDGRFSFNHPTGPYRLAAMNDEGYAEATPEKFVKSPTMALAAWGKVKGEARIGGMAAVNQPISISRRDDQPGSPTGVNAFYSIETRTDAEGRFHFDRVIPGAIEVARVIITEFGNGSQQHMFCWQEPVDVGPGQTSEVRIGGRGRAVIGRVVVQGPPGVRVDWRQNRPATIAKARNRNPFAGFIAPDPRQNDRFAASLDRDGRFRVEDVPPGHYELTVRIDSPPVSNRPGAADEIGRVTVPVDVPEVDHGAAVDLGEITAKVKGS